MTTPLGKAMVSLRHVTPQDFPTIERWLNKDYIKKWYGEPEEWLSEIRNDSGEFGWLHHCMVLYQETPIGFCQYYDCSKTPPGFEWDAEPKGSFCIDYLIGEEPYLKQGLGSSIIQKLCQLICTHESPVQILADPVPENVDSIRLLERNGFTLDPATGLYKHRITK